MTSVRYQSRLFSFDGLNSNCGTTAAYIAGLNLLPNSARPDWIVQNCSDGFNLFNRPVPRAAVVVAWLTGVGPYDGTTALEFLHLRSLPESFGTELVKHIQADRHKGLLGAAYYAMVARAVSLCCFGAELEDVLKGPDRHQLIQSAVELYQSPHRYFDFHKALIENSASGISSPRMTERKPGLQIDLTAVLRPCSDTAYTVAVPPLRIEQFATIGQALRVLHVEFRRRLWERRGIYACGLTLSITNRAVSIWTHLDRDPVSTFHIARELISNADKIDVGDYRPVRSLGPLYAPLPSWVGNDALQALGDLWGLYASDYNALADAPICKTTSLKSWLNATGVSAFAACGPSDQIAPCRQLGEARIGNYNVAPA